MDKKTTILKVALELFVERGFYGTPTSLIAKTAGISNGTLFYYFPTKEILVNEVYMMCKESARRSLAQGIDGIDSIEGKLARFVENGIYWSLSHQLEFRFLQQYRYSAVIDEFTKEKGWKYFTFLVETVQEGKEKKIVKDLKTDLLVEMLIGIGTTIDWYIINNRVTVDDAFVKSAVKMALDCMKA